MSNMRKCGFSALAALVLTATAYAAPVTCTSAPVCFFEKNEGGIGETNILFGSPKMGFLISGFDKLLGKQVDFMSDGSTPTELSAKGGQSDIDAANAGFIHDLTVTVPGGKFGDFILNLSGLASVPNTLHVSVLLANGTTDTHTYGTHLNGDNFLTVLANTGAGDAIESITITSEGTNSGFMSLKQPRISDITGGTTVVPEPSSMMLLGGGLLVLVRVLRRTLTKEMQERLGLQ